MKKVLIILINCFCVIHNSDATIKWSTCYKLKATLTIPSAQVEEPYEVWVNEKTKNARVYFYGGIDKLYREVSASDKSTLTYYKVFPETTESQQNKIKCEKRTMADVSALNYSYLPVKDFKFHANESIDGEKTQKWGYTTIIDKANNKKLIYTIWITFKNNNIPVPKRYEFRINFGDTEFEYFRHDYHYFDDTNIDNDFHEEIKDLNCVPATESANVDPLVEFVDPQFEEERNLLEFEKFKENHRKQYQSSDEHNLRRHIFKNNLRYINSINRQHKSYSLGVNQFADLTDVEIAKLSDIRNTKSDNNRITTKKETVKVNDSINLEGVLSPLLKDKDLTENFDWRDYKAITPVKDQTLLCGSCYAFTTAAVIESAAFISRGCKKLRELSEQAIIDCSWSDNESISNLGCLGGTCEFALDWVKRNGLPTKKEYGPYLAQEGLCHIKNMTMITRIIQYRQIHQGPNMDHSIKIAIRNYGPLLASINIDPKSFIFYKNGVYDDTRCRNEKDERSHGVTVMGYGNEDGKDYLLIKNSWGTNWGEGGYMKLASSFYNICGIKNFLYHVMFSKNHSKKCFKK